MTATAHALVGAAIALKISDPRISLPLAFVSHFVFDKLPHWDPMTNHTSKTKKRIFWETVADVLLSVFLCIVLFFVKFQPGQETFDFARFFWVGATAFTAQVPDWLEIPYFYNLPDFLKAEWNYKLQHIVHDIWFDSRTQAPWGIITQVAVVAIFIWWGLS